VSEPGELSKVLMSNMADALITEPDCGTKNGILLPVSDTNIIDRYLAREAGGFTVGTLVTANVQTALRRKKVLRVLVRSPMTCEAADGVCQLCQGLDGRGNPHKMGTNVGVRAASALAEPLTQFALDAKHGVRTAKGDRARLQGIAGFRQVLETPKMFMNKATLAEIDGTVTKVETAPQGGHYVHVGDQSHYVSPRFDVVVTKGQKVEHGDRLSEGIPKPDEVVRHKGLAAGRQYMVDTLRKLYADQGQDLDQRHFELLAKNELNHVRILRDPGNHFLKGDVITYNALRAGIAQDTKEVALKDALGETLGKAYLSFSVGQRVTPEMAGVLRREGVKSVFIAPRAPEVEFLMKPATRAPLLHPDWMARLAHRHLKNTLHEAAQFGEISNLHGTHPVPAYAAGVSFGRGEVGRY